MRRFLSKGRTGHFSLVKSCVGGGAAAPLELKYRRNWEGLHFRIFPDFGAKIKSLIFTKKFEKILAIC